MNRRELLAGAGLAAGVAALDSAAQNTRNLPAAERKYKVVITGGHPGDPSMAVAAQSRASRRVGTMSCCFI